MGVNFKPGNVKIQSITSDSRAGQIEQRWRSRMQLESRIASRAKCPSCSVRIPRFWGEFEVPHSCAARNRRVR